MIRAFKIFVSIIVCLALVSMPALSANSTSQNVVITVTDTHGNILRNLEVKATDNLTMLSPDHKTYKATYKGKGMYVIPDQCANFKKMFQQKKPVTVWAADPLKQFQDTSVNITTKCNVTIRMPLPKPSYKYPNAVQMQQLALTKSGNVKLYGVCTSTADIPSQVVFKCKKSFAKTQVQVLQAQKLAKMFIAKDTGVPESEIICSDKSYAGPVSNDDYIRCTSKNGRYAYEFQFDDVRETSTARLREDVFSALCRVFNSGTYNKDYIGCKKSTEEKTRDMCIKQLREDAEEFSWTTNLQINNAGYCLVNFKDMTDYYGYKPKTYGDIDVMKFKEVSVQSKSALVTFLQQYVKTKLGGDARTGGDFRSLKCASGFREWISPEGSKQQLFTCTLTTRDNRQHEIEFVFKDMAISKNSESNAGYSAMSCIAGGGTFDGEQCRGLTHEECDNLNVPGGTQWDEELKQCTLKDAAKYQKQIAVTKTLITVGAIAASVAVCVVTFGAGGPVVLVAITAAGAALSVGGTITNTVVSHNVHKKTDEFLTAYDMCKNKSKFEQPGCARGILRKFYGYISTLTDAKVFDDRQYVSALSEVLQDTIELLNDPDYDITQADVDEYQAGVEKASAQIRTKITADYVTFAGDLLMIFGGNSLLATKLASKGVSMVNGVAKATNTSKTAKFLARVYNLSKKINTKGTRTVSNITGTIGTANDEVNAINTISTTTMFQ